MWNFWYLFEFCGIIWFYLKFAVFWGFFWGFLVFMESKSCLHELSNYQRKVIWSHDLSKLFEFSEFSGIYSGHSGFIWFDLIFFVILWIFLGFFWDLWHQKIPKRIFNQIFGNFRNLYGPFCACLIIYNFLNNFLNFFGIFRYL